MKIHNPDFKTYHKAVVLTTAWQIDTQTDTIGLHPKITPHRGNRVSDTGIKFSWGTAGGTLQQAKILHKTAKAMEVLKQTAGV